MYLTLAGIVVMMYSDILTFQRSPLFSVFSDNLQTTFSSIFLYKKTRRAMEKTSAVVFREVTSFDFSTAVSTFCTDNFPHVKFGIVVFGDIEKSSLNDLEAFRDKTRFGDHNMFLIRAASRSLQVQLEWLLNEEGVLEYVVCE